MRVITGFVLGTVVALSAHDARAQEQPVRCVDQDRRGGEIAEAIVGFQQAGAASANHSQNYFFNLFISRPLPFTRNIDYPCVPKSDNARFGPASRWWGNVRVANWLRRPKA